MIKKAMFLIVLSLAILGASGCMTPDTQTMNRIYNAGYVAAVLYTSKEKPSAETVVGINDTIVFVTSTIEKLDSTNSYSKILIPIVNDYIVNNSNISDIDKPLVQIASTYVLMSLDDMLINVPVSDNSGYRYMKQFGTGFADGINAYSPSTEVQGVLNRGYDRANYIP